MRNAAMLNGRITTEQMEWLQEKADALGGNLSAALRQAITNARLLEMARNDYRALREQQPEWDIPDDEDDGTTRVLTTVLAMKMSEPDDLALRELELERGRQAGT
jgi:hypothetical protein